MFIDNLFYFLGTGNGGVGKSYLSRTICKWTEKILSKSGLIKTKVVRLAFAAIAASNIGKYFYFVFNSYFFMTLNTLSLCCRWYYITFWNRF